MSAVLQEGCRVLPAVPTQEEIGALRPAVAGGPRSAC